MSSTSNPNNVRVLNGSNVLANTSASDNAFVASSGEILFRDSSGQYTKRRYSLLNDISIEKSKKETAQVTRVTIPALTANSEYSFYIVQDVDNAGSGSGNGTERISYIKSTTPTNAEVEAGLKSVIDAFVTANKLKVSVAVSGSGYIDITGAAGYPLFQVKGLTNLTAAANQPTIAPHGTPGTAIAGTTTVTVTTLAAHGLSVGDSVDISGVATMTLTYEGTSGLAAVSDVRVATVPTTTTFTLEGVVATGTNSGTIVITHVAQEDRGQGADLLALGVVDTFFPSASTSAFGSSDAYTKVSFSGSGAKSVSGVDGSLGYQDGVLDIYVEEDATNYADLLARAVEVQNAYTYGATTADAALVSA